MPDPTSPYPPDYHLAWSELGGFLRTAAKANQTLGAAELLDYMQEMHERYGLPPARAPKRDAR